MLIEVAVRSGSSAARPSGLLADGDAVFSARRTGLGARGAAGSAMRRWRVQRPFMIAAIGVIASVVIAVATPLVTWAIPFPAATRIAIAVATLVPIGVALGGIPMPPAFDSALPRPPDGHLGLGITARCQWSAQLSPSSSP